MSTKRISSAEIIIWLFVFLLLALVASPFALGFKIKNDYADLTQKISSMMSIDVRMVKYDRGYFSADALLEVQLPGLPFALQFKEKIIHGPVYLGLLNQGKSPFIAAVVNGKMLPVIGFENIIEQVFSGQPALIYQNLIDFVGNVDSDAYISPINTFIEQDSGRLIINSSAMLITEYYSAQEEKISGEVNLSKLLINSDDVKISLNNLNISFAGKIGNNGLLIGDSVLSLDKLNAQSHTDQFSLRNFSASSVSTEVGSLLNSQIRINTQEILLSNQKLGPIIFALGINGLNANSINQLSDIQQRMDANIRQGIPAEQVNAQLMGEIITVVPELLKQAVISIDPFSVQSELGKLEASVNFSVDGMQQNTVTNPLFLLNAIRLEVNLAVDESLLKQLLEWQLSANESELLATANKQARKIEAQISMTQKIDENIRGLMDENWLTYANGKYSSNIKLQQGLMTINSKQIDPMAQIISQMQTAPAATRP
jgi:uncharacterized protein YdgA (DUF945 family)